MSLKLGTTTIAGLPDVSGKVNTDMDNLTATGKSYAAGIGKPSSSYENLTLGSDGSTYTPTANGYYSLKCIINNAGAYIQFVVDNLYSSMIARDGGNGVSIWIPVQKGETCTFHTNASLYVESFKFVYAQGEV